MPDIFKYYDNLIIKGCDNQISTTNYKNIGKQVNGVSCQKWFFYLWLLIHIRQFISLCDFAKSILAIYITFV